MIRTKVFDLARDAGYQTDSDLARGMGISKTHVSNVRSGERQPGPEFITGALRAFPGKSFHDLFDVVDWDGADPEPISAQPTAATGERG